MRRKKTHTRIINGRHTLILYNVDDLWTRKARVLDLHSCVYLTRPDLLHAIAKTEGFLSVAPNIFRKITPRKWYRHLKPQVKNQIKVRELSRKFWDKDNLRRVATLFRNGLSYPDISAYIFQHMDHKITTRTLIKYALKNGWI